MDSILKKGVLLVSVTGIMTAFPMVVHAADIDDTQNIPAAESTQILEDCYTSDKTISVKDHLVPEQKGEYSDMAFANVQSFLYIRSEPTTDSEWVGKLYPDYAAKITGPVGEWTKVESGNVTGYVYSRYITVGNEAQKKAEELVQNNDTGNAEDAFTYAESREEEAARLQKEQEEQKAQAAGNGQAIVDYACQFIGNPYVWGGTSLTNGADCSGFVQSVFAHFGIALPRTTWDMENAGTAVSYDQAVAGDIILYNGHVGIYMGNGQIVNAINSAKGIGILPATYTNIGGGCVVQRSEQILFHVTDWAAVLCKALQHKTDMVGVQLHKAAAHHLGGLIVPGNAQQLAVGSAGVHQQIHDLVEGIFIIRAEPEKKVYLQRT